MARSDARNARQRKWLARLSEDMREDIEAGAETGDLAGEIGVLRYALTKAMAEIDDPAKLAETVTRLVNATRSAVLAQRIVSGDKAADLTDALTRVLADLGLSE